MRARKKLTPEEKVALALDVLKETRSFLQICEFYQVSHTTAYTVRNAFIEGGRRALAGDEPTLARLRQLEALVAHHDRVIGQRAKADDGSRRET
jgi:transposase-like protein